MFNIALTEFVQTPWTVRVRDAMFNALNVNKHIKCEIIEIILKKLRYSYTCWNKKHI